MIKLTGDMALLKNFDLLPVKMQKKHGRRALTKAGRLVVSAAKPHVPVRYGHLADSLGQRGRTYGNHTVVSVVGPRAGHKFTFIDPDGKKHVPAKIAHLVENGHGGPHPAGPHPFLRPAYDETRQSTRAVIVVELAKGVEQEGV